MSVLTMVLCARLSWPLASFLSAHWIIAHNHRRRRHGTPLLRHGIQELRIVIVLPEQVLVLFWSRTRSLLSSLGTFLVPESDHAKHFC